MSSWEKNIRKVVPYTPGEQPKRRDIIKLNTNENPYPPAPGVQKKLEEYNSEELRLYPDACVSELVDTLAQYYGVESDSVFVGVGSDDVLAMCFLTFFNSDKPVFFPDIPYARNTNNPAFCSAVQGSLCSALRLPFPASFF